MTRVLSTALAVLLFALWSAGSFLPALCQCAHGPEVACECPHHHGDEGLPPCHRAAAQRAREAKRQAEGERGSFKNKCGATFSALTTPPPALIARSPGVPQSPPPEAPARWRTVPDALLERALSLDPPPPRAA